MSDGSLFERARQAVKVKTVAEGAVKLVRVSGQLRGPCPVCKAGAKSVNPPFWVVEDDGRWWCFSCETGGDVVDLERELRGGKSGEAAWRLIGGDYAKTPVLDAVAPPKEDGKRGGDRLKWAAEMWDGARPIAGTLAERYLVARKVCGEVIAALNPDALRYHPFARVGWDDQARSWVKAPALVCRPETTAGPSGGVHATYLLRDGSGRDKALGKKMWGPQKGPDGRPCGAWLIGPVNDWAPGAELVVGEGIETVLSVVTLRLRAGLRSRACVALSLNRLQGGEARDGEGCVDPFHAAPDPEKPPFVWPVPEADPWPGVVVAVDRDMSPIEVRGRTPRGKVCKFERDGEVRARLCGALAVQAWTRPVDQGGGGAARSRAIAPPARSDFNDELRRVVALECDA